MEFHRLSVVQKKQETADTVTLEFGVPEHLSDTFQYMQGQYLTLRADINGRELRRAYSMSSSPLEKRLAVTVKKVNNGQFSTFLHDRVQAGDELEVAEPQGRFYVPLSPDKRRTYYLFASGSGITPIMSILKTTLEQEPMSAIYLMYGSRSEDQIIFKDELDQLTERYQGQLMVEYVLSQPRKENVSGGFLGIFKKTTTNWLGWTGRIDARSVGRYLDENLPHGPENDCQYFICGPGDMPDVVKAALMTRSIPAAQVHVEHFVNANHVPGEGAVAADGGVPLVAIVRGQRIKTTIPAGMTILDALVRDKHDVPYSCTAGACSTCMAKIVNGTVAMDACYALDDDEVKAGYILTCQAKPTSGSVEVTYD
jgi:ring-1,2-phenylacetyl-CoA epoxidase subunit PaaE